MVQVLLIDDDESHNLILKQVLESNGHTVIIADNGHDGFQKIAQTPDLDVVIADERMPIMTGTELKAKVLKEIPNPPVFYILTGHRSDENWQQGVLYKPVDKGDLLDIIELSGDLSPDTPPK